MVPLPGPACITIARRLWAPVADELDGSAVRWLSLVLDLPEISRSLGPGAKDALMKNQDMLSEALQAIRIVDDIIQRLGDAEDLAPSFRGLGARYAQAGVHPHHFDYIQRSLVELVEEMSRACMESESRDAFRQVFEFVKDGMLPSLVQTHSEKAVIETVQNSWKLVLNGGEDLSVQIFLKIFELDSTILKMFGFGNQAEARNSTSLRAHALLVVRKIDEAVQSMNNVDHLVAMLRKLGASHGHLGIQAQHWIIFGQAIMWTLQTRWGEKWTPEMQNGWNQMFSTIRAVMEPAVAASAKVHVQKSAASLSAPTDAQKSIPANRPNVFMEPNGTRANVTNGAQDSPASTACDSNRKRKLVSFSVVSHL